METIIGIPTHTLTDREILLLTYQQLQAVSEEFKSYKTSNEATLRDLQERIAHVEQYMATSDGIKKDSEARVKKLVTVIGVVITVVNFAVSVVVQLLSRKL